MIPKGRRDKDGYQRFTYPPIEKMLVRPTSPPTVTSISPARVAPQRGCRIWWKGADWRGYYGMRSLVESSNNLLKTAPHGDIENTKKRSGRGYAATFLALTFAVVASNLKRIVTFFEAEAPPGTPA